jgi:hypothetical protein
VAGVCYYEITALLCSLVSLAAIRHLSQQKPFPPGYLLRQAFAATIPIKPNHNHFRSKGFGDQIGAELPEGEQQDQNADYYECRIQPRLDSLYSFNG